MADYKTMLHAPRAQSEGDVAESSQLTHHGHVAAEVISLCGFRAPTLWVFVTAA